MVKSRSRTGSAIRRTILHAQNELKHTNDPLPSRFASLDTTMLGITGEGIVNCRMALQRPQSVGEEEPDLLYAL